MEALRGQSSPVIVVDRRPDIEELLEEVCKVPDDFELPVVEDAPVLDRNLTKGEASGSGRCSGGKEGD